MTVSKFSLCAFLVALAVTGVAGAQANLKIGFVNVGRLIEQSPQSATITKLLQDEFGPRQRDLTALQQRLRTQQETFQRDAPVMGEQERLNLERQIRDGQRDYQRSESEYLEDLNVRRNEEIGKLLREVLLKAQEYGRAQQYDLVLTDSAIFSNTPVPNVIFASTAVDITEAVLATLNPAGSR